jgi:uncharacterized protein YdeI (YjbR/CyaY-like superfamily)
MPVKSFEDYLEKNSKWEKELITFREIILSTSLEEAIKWGAPIYTLKNKNVVGLGAFKNHCALWFFNGALLEKNTSLLVNAQEGKTKALRQIKFEIGDEIPTSLLKKYVKEAIELQQAGKEVKPVKNKHINIPEELQIAFEKSEALEEAFQNLSKGKQREFAEHITTAKREATRKNRLEKCIPLILDGVGLHDKYRK